MAIFTDIIFFISFYFLFCYRKWRKRNKKDFVTRTIFYIYLIFVFYFTLMPIFKSVYCRIFSDYRSKINLIPFVDVIHRHGDYYRQIILNIIMTIPFGFMLPIIKKFKNKLISTTAATALFSFLIEFSQYVFAIERAVDITDIITNTFGGFIGCIIYIAIEKFCFKHKNHS